MKELEYFFPFDTVEVTFPSILKSTYNLKSFLLSYNIHSKTDRYYSDVFVSVPNMKMYTFMGDNVMLKTTRIVLVEKYDFRLMESIKHLPPGFSSKKYSFQL